jgi:hypothetical protein
VNVLRHPVYWCATVATVLLLAGSGVVLAWLLVPKPPTYHRTTFFEFALPAGWACAVEGTETVCRPAGPPPHDAIIIFAAKFRNASDNLAAYRAHVSEPKTGSDAAGATFLSRVERVEEREIGDYRWVDALHFESEIRNYYTRYLATTTAQIGVLITFSAHRSTFDMRMKEFRAGIESLRIQQAPSRYN